MTSLEYAERTRISTILREIMLNLIPEPAFPMNPTPANLDFDLLGMAPHPSPGMSTPHPLPS